RRRQRRPPARDRNGNLRRGVDRSQVGPRRRRTGRDERSGEARRRGGNLGGPRERIAVRQLPAISVARPVTVTILVLVAVLLGVVSLTRLSIDLLPELKFPIAAVATSYEGAGPHEVESLVSRPIEEAMTTAGGVTSVSSVSSRGQSLVL